MDDTKVLFVKLKRAWKIPWQVLVLDCWAVPAERLAAGPGIEHCQPQ